MEPIEIIALHFEQFKKNPEAASNDFFESVWRYGTYLPKEESRQLFDRIFEWGKSHAAKSPHVFAMVHCALAFHRHHAENFGEAVDYAIKGHKLFEALGDYDGMAACDIMAGFPYRSMGEMEASIKYCLEGIEQLNKTGAFKMIHIIGLYCLGGIYIATNQNDEAIRLFKQGMQIEDRLGPGINFLRPRLLNGIADVYMKQNKFSLALKNYENALEICDTCSEKTFRGRGLTDLGDYFDQMGNYEEAIRYNKEALVFRNMMKLQSAAITNMINLGGLYTRTGKNDDAVSVLEEGLALAEELQVKAKMFQIHRMLSDIYLGMNNMTQSMLHLKAYQQVREDVNHEDMERKAKNQKTLFEAEQTRKENAIIKAQKAEIEHKNKKLSETIEELTITKISRRAKAITLFIAVALIVIEGVINHFIVNPYAHDNLFVNLAAEGLIVLMLKPIEKAIEHYLLSNVIRRKRAKEAVEVEMA